VPRQIAATEETPRFRACCSSCSKRLKPHERRGQYRREVLVTKENDWEI